MRRLALWVNRHLSEFVGIIVVDDLHKVHGEGRAEESALICAFIGYLIDSTKNRISWIIATRDTLDLPLASWLALGVSDLPIEEFDLALTREEARLIAWSSNGSINSATVDVLFDVTRGLPFAFSLGVRAATSADSPATLADITRFNVQRLFTEQVFAQLDRECRSFLLGTALFRELDVALLVQAGFTRAEAIIDRLRRRTALVSQDREGVFRYHDLFQDFAAEMLVAAGEDAVSEAYSRTRNAYEAAGNIVLALELASAQRDATAILKLLPVHTVALVNQGEIALVRRAVDSSARSANAETAIALFSCGCLNWSDGRTEDALILLTLPHESTTNIGGESPSQTARQESHLEEIAFHRAADRRDPQRG
ncbi:MAG TPA: hypothetical protein VME66_12635 [Candidatus Acidoferrales bacterium]|nr:hypothetical protein [Candidatus Acidoferrales bacterium]